MNIGDWIIVCALIVFFVLTIYMNWEDDPEWDRVVKSAIADGSFWSLLD